MKREKNINIYGNIEIYDEIKNKNYKTLKVFKDNHRSYVALIEIDNKKMVYKEPREKNRRKWQRFLSIFRGSESYREYKNIMQAKNLGFPAPQPYLAVERKKFCMSKFSYYVYEYIEGRESKTEDIDMIREILDSIHSKGYLHGDSQVMNFLINEDKIYIIDTKLIKNIYGKIGEIYEYIYLEESCSKDIEYDKKSVYYKIAIALKKYLIWFSRMKKKIRRRD